MEGLSNLFSVRYLLTKPPPSQISDQQHSWHFLDKVFVACSIILNRGKAKKSFKLVFSMFFLDSLNFGSVVLSSSNGLKSPLLEIVMSGNS